MVTGMDRSVLDAGWPEYQMASFKDGLDLLSLDPLLLDPVATGRNWALVLHSVLAEQIYDLGPGSRSAQPGLLHSGSGSSLLLA